MYSRQAFLTLTIVDGNTMLARPILPITSLFFLALSLYHRWLNVCELAGAILDLVHALACAAVPFWYVGVILYKSLAFGIGVKL
jgi:hypothetical protein